MTIHKALVAAQSAGLRSLVTGSMEEANSGKVVWEDVDEDTFVLFAEFVYTGNYATALKTLADRFQIQNTLLTLVVASSTIWAIMAGMIATTLTRATRLFIMRILS